MSWDLIIGLIIGLAGSVLGLVGSIVINKQNHTQEIKVIKQNHEQEIKVNNQKKELEKELAIQRITLENSFKDFELGRQFAKELADETGQAYKIYPYDMYLLTYSKIVEYMNQKNQSTLDLNSLLNDMNDIKHMYDTKQSP